MKKRLMSFSVILSMVLLSCNDGGDASTTESTTTSTDSANTTGAGSTAGNAAPVGETDRQFMMEAASGGMMEVELGRIASQSASHDRVKSFGNMMVQDHTNANNELKAIASGKNVMLPDSMMTKHREHLEMMRNKSGKEFDRAYMNMMVQDHNQDVSNFQKASNSAQDADLKGFASKTLPILQMHLDSAKAINTAVKGGKK